jgi:hypothetical protein
MLTLPKSPVPARSGARSYSGHYGQMYPYFRKVLRENSTEKRSRKIPSMCPECPETSGTGIAPPIPVPPTLPKFPVRARPGARSCSGQLPNGMRSPAHGCPLRVPGQPPGFSGDGWGLSGNFPAGLFPKNFQPEFDEKFSRPLLKMVSHDLSRNEVLLLDILHELGVWKDA